MHNVGFGELREVDDITEFLDNPELDNGVYQITGSTLAWSPSGKKLAVCSNERLYIVDPASGVVAHEVDTSALHLDERAFSGKVVWNHSETRVAVGMHLAYAGMAAHVVDVASGLVLHENIEMGPAALAWDPADTKLASADFGFLRIFEPAYGFFSGTVKELDLGGDLPESIAFHLKIAPIYESAPER